MKGNRFSDIVKEYVKRLSDDDLQFLNIRLSNRLGGDVGEAVELLQKNTEVDKWLASSNNAMEFFDMLDLVEQHLQHENQKRYSYEPKEKKVIRTAATQQG